MQRLGKVSNILNIGIGTCTIGYVYGALISNVSLSQHGAFIYAILDESYASTAILFLLISIPFFLLGILFSVHYEVRYFESKVKNVEKVIFFIIPIIILLLFYCRFADFSWFYGLYEKSYNKIGSLSLKIWWLFYNGIVFFFMGSSLAFYQTSLKRSQSQLIRKSFYKTTGVVALLIFFTFLLVSFHSASKFALLLYPEIDRFYGGGKPQKVQFKFNRNEIRHGFVCESNTYFIFDETKETFIVGKRPDSITSYQVKKKDIMEIKFFKDF